MPDATRDRIDPAISELIRRKAHQLCHRAGLTQQDRNDIRQQLLTHLLERLPGVGAGRAYPEGLVLTVLFRCAANLRRARRAAKRDYRRARPLGDADDVPAGRGCSGRSDEEVADLVADVAEVLAGVRPEDRHLAERLMHHSLAEVARESGVPRTTLYTAIRRLRQRFERAGLRDYL